MDPDRVDEGTAPVHAPPATEHGAAPERLRRPDDHLPGAVGNAAFSRVVRAALGPGVARSAARSQGAGPLSPEIADEIQDARGGGTALPDPVRSDMEAGLGVDLSAVRVHTDSRADTLSRSVQAEAFTTGTDVFFRAGTYAPGSQDGQRLLAHELTHVVQQSSGEVEGGRVSHPDDAHEVEARSVADALSSSSRPAAAAVDRSVDGVDEAGGGPSQGAVSREELDEEEAVEPAVARQELEEEEEPEEA